MVTMFDMFENAGDGAFAVDDDQRIVFWNASAEQLLGFRSEDVMGINCYRFLAGCDLLGSPICRQHCPILAKCLRGEPVGSFEMIASCQDAREVRINVSTLFLPRKRDKEEGTHSHLIHTFRYMGDAPAVNDELRIHLLGTTTVARADGMLLDGPMWRRAKVRALLAYLLLNRGLRVSRDTLARSIWPDVPQKKAHHNLNTTIYYLRHSLEPNLERGSDSQFLGYENGHYNFRADSRHWLDIDSFESGINSARREADLARAVYLYRDALRHYHGDFQTDIKSDWIWHRSVRERLRNLHSGAFEELALLLEQSQYEEEAIDIYSQLLSLRPWHEGACKRLMQLRLKRGDPEAAICHYQKLAQALGDEMVATPGEETQRLFNLANRAI